MTPYTEGETCCRCLERQQSCFPHVHKHSSGELGSVMRRHNDGTHTSVTCPKSIIDCNTHMGGVGRVDQLRGYYSCRTKSRKFY